VKCSACGLSVKTVYLSLVCRMSNQLDSSARVEILRRQRDWWTVGVGGGAQWD